MLAIDRQNSIIQELNANGSVTVSELSKQFCVTEETIRRDLEKLEKSNMLRRVHGGAYLLHGFDKEAPVKLRENILLSEKQRIGKRCCDMINHYDTIMLDSSTTALYIAKNLRLENKKVTVITNSLHAIKEFENSENIKVICIGGTLRTYSHSFSGFESITLLNMLIADKAFVSAAGIHMGFGITDHNENEAHIRAAMLNRSSEKIFIADSTKFGKSFVNVVCPLEKLDIVVTDTKPSGDWCAEMDALNIKLLVS